MSCSINVYRVQILFFLITLGSISCNNESQEKKGHTDIESKINEAPLVDTFEMSQRMANDPKYADSMNRYWEEQGAKESERIQKEQEKYSEEDWNILYKVGLENYLKIENVKVLYDENYNPTLHLTIRNSGGLKIISMKLLAGADNSYNRNFNSFIIKRTIPPKSSSSFQVGIPSDIAKGPFSIISAIGANSEKFEIPLGYGY